MPQNLILLEHRGLHASQGGYYTFLLLLVFIDLFITYITLPFCSYWIWDSIDYDIGQQVSFICQIYIPPFMIP